MISGKQLSWTYKKGARHSQILKNVSFEVRKGRITTFMGPSGAGKTSLLRCMANLQTGYEGTILCEGEELVKLNPVQRASKIGFVLQQFHLFPHLTVLENCTVPLINASDIKREEAEQRCLEVLGALGMLGTVHSMPSQLSGGQQQRAAIARALVLHPDVLLLDEPTSALDPDSKRSLETLLLELNSKGITLALSSHDMPFIRRIMDYVYFMRDGEIIEEWDAKLHGTACPPKIEEFLSHI